MSRILEALKNAVPGSRSQNPPPSKPLIFEKVSFDAPTPETVRREVEAKKESARIRYLLNEKPASGPGSKTHWIRGGSAFLIACTAAFWLWPRPSGELRRLAEENMRLHENIAALESRAAERQAELDDRRALQSAPTAEQAEELESMRGEVRRLNRRLAVMLEDNLAKDQEITRLSGR